MRLSKYLRIFCHGDVQLKVDNILIFHYVFQIDAHMNNSIVNWSTFYLKEFVMPL
jgi:hypothetical protein